MESIHPQYGSMGGRRIKDEYIEESNAQREFIKPEPEEEETYTYDVDFGTNPMDPIVTQRHEEPLTIFDPQIPPPTIPAAAGLAYPIIPVTPTEELPVSHHIVPPPLLSCYAHPANVPVQAPSHAIADISDQAYMLKKAKMELYNRDLKNLTSRTQLIEYMLKQSSDPIPDSDPMLMFNCILSTRKGVIGAQHLAQVSCFANPNLDTYICLQCQHWTTESEMFKHLKSEIHRINYMQRNKEYQTMHAKILCQPDSKSRAKMVDECAYKIAAEEGIKKCETRMRVVLNEAAIARIWPDYLEHFDDSWQTGNFNDDEIKDVKEEEADTKVGIKNEDEYGEATELKPSLAKLKARLDLEDGELSDSDDEDEEEQEEDEYEYEEKFQPTTSINLLSTADIKPKFAKLDEDSRILSALILIRQEVFDQRTFSRSLIDFICKESGITAAEALKFRNITDVGERIGDESFTSTLAPVTEYYHDRQIKEFEIPATPPATHPAVLLTQMGIEKQQVAVLLRSLAEFKMNHIPSTPQPSSTPTLNAIERDKHGSIIHKNYQSEFPYKELPLSVLAPNPEKDSAQHSHHQHGYRRPHSSVSSSSSRAGPPSKKIKREDNFNDSSFKDEPVDWDSASDVVEDILR
uniref:C2H2-type domain-containing protein n=1 Tax=Panagrolaimus davidi TaxID=227884 RepID=A0A914PZX0_9BILA